MLCACFLFSGNSLAQDSVRIAELKAIINNPNEHDTAIIEAYLDIGSTYARTELDSVIPYCEKALALIEPALKKHNDPVVVETFLDKKSSALNNIGFVYYYKGDYNKAIEYYSKSFEIVEGTNKYQTIGSYYNNMALIYNNLNYYDDALMYYRKGLGLFLSINDSNGIAMSWNNLGYVFRNIEQYDSALIYLELARDLYQQLGDDYTYTYTLTNIGAIYGKREEYDKAIAIHKECLRIREANGYADGISQSLNHLANMYFAKGETDTARSYALRGYESARQMNNAALMQLNARMLADIYATDGNWQEAYKMREIELSLDKQLASKENEKLLIKKQFEYEYKKQKEIDELKQNAEKQRQKIIGGIILGGVAVLLLIILFVINRLRKTRKQNKIISNQKALIEDKQKEIIDSIEYASRIQVSIQPDFGILKQRFHDAFLFLRPKDIVSGDFYWFAERNDNYYICVADCTGHGVPGSLMSMLGINYLNQIIEENISASTNQILNELHVKIKQSMNANEYTARESNDGMDIAMIKINPRNRSIHFTGAGRPLYYFNAGELKVLNGSRYSIGGIKSEGESFEEHELPLDSTGMMYLFSDGYADQMGGDTPDGKKLKTGNFKKILKGLHTLPIEEQKQVLIASFDSWRNGHDQIDDVCVLGINPGISMKA